ncbi:MAG: anti-sigma B factor antagonist [Planctomycetota bacterium]|nr:MAG: anti-sigma B factor antagonist [Planctomycetota bacterium]
MADNQRTNNLVKEVRRTPEGTVVALTGDVDLHHSPALHAALVEVAGERPRRMILNLADVPYIDSSGVGTFVEVFRRVSAYKGKMVFCGLSSRVKSVFEITKLDKFFIICDTEEQALKA